MTANGTLAGRPVLVPENDYLLGDDEISLPEAAGAALLVPV